MTRRALNFLRPCDGEGARAETSFLATFDSLLFVSSFFSFGLFLGFVFWSVWKEERGVWTGGGARGEEGGGA